MKTKDDKCYIRLVYYLTQVYRAKLAISSVEDENPRQKLV